MPVCNDLYKIFREAARDLSRAQRDLKVANYKLTAAYVALGLARAAELNCTILYGGGKTPSYSYILCQKVADYASDQAAEAITEAQEEIATAQGEEFLKYLKMKSALEDYCKCKTGK